MSIQSEANNRWRKKNREVLQLTLLPDEKEMIKEKAKKKSKSMTAYLIDLARKDTTDGIHKRNE